MNECTNELINDPLLDGKPAAIRKSLQRLLKRGLIEVRERNSYLSYKAVLVRGEGAISVPSS